MIDKVGALGHSFVMQSTAHPLSPKLLGSYGLPEIRTPLQPFALHALAPRNCGAT